MHLTMAEALDDLAAEFALMDDWEDRYRYVIDMGRDLDALSEQDRTDANKVRGCASQVWLLTRVEPDGRLTFKGDSDAHIVRGLIAILVRLYSGRPADKIAQFDAKAAFDRLGLAGALSSQRSNGLNAMVERIRRDATAVAAAG